MAILSNISLVLLSLLFPHPTRLRNLTLYFTPLGMILMKHHFLVQFSSVAPVAQSCLTLCDPMNCSMPGLPVQHQLPESTQTHVHRVGDAIQLSHPLSSHFPPAFNLSQHQGIPALSHLILPSWFWETGFIGMSILWIANLRLKEPK